MINKGIIKGLQKIGYEIAEEGEKTLRLSKVYLNKINEEITQKIRKNITIDFLNKEVGTYAEMLFSDEDFELDYPYIENYRFYVQPEELKELTKIYHTLKEEK